MDWDWDYIYIYFLYVVLKEIAAFLVIFVSGVFGRKRESWRINKKFE